MNKDKIIELDIVKTCKEKQSVMRLIQKEFDIFDDYLLNDYAEKFAHKHDEFVLAVFTYAFTRGFIKGKEFQ